MKGFLEKNKSNLVFIIISLLVFVLFILSFVWPMIPTKEKEKEEVLINEKPLEIKTVLVDIKGQIKSPGVYEMENNERVNDVIKKAGGLTSNADTSLINLSQKVKDEMVIIIYSKEEVKEMTEEDPCVCPEINDACVNDENTVEITTKDGVVTEQTEGKVSINTASKEDLMTLDGVGESKAVSIIEYRKQNGNFKTIEDIMNVSGIGEALFAKIKDYITI